MNRAGKLVPLRVLLKRGKSGAWLAICLERYIVAQGETPDDARQQFAFSLAAEIILGVEMGNSVAHPLEGIAPAPVRYWDMFEQAKSEEKNPKIQLPDLGKILPSIPAMPKFAALRLAEAA